MNLSFVVLCMAATALVALVTSAPVGLLLRPFAEGPSMTFARRIAQRTTIPTRARILRVLAAGLVWLCSSQLHAQPLTEADVVRLVKLRDPELTIAGARAALSASAEFEASRYPNPALAWNRAEVPGSGPLAEHDDSFVLTVPIDLSGRRGAAVELVRSETAEARAVEARTRGQAVLGGLSRFYAALAAQRRAEINAAAAQRIDEAARVLQRRFEAGSASGYDRTRIELEAQLVHSELREARGREMVERTELATLLGIDPAQVRLEGSLEPGAGQHSASAGRPASLELAKTSVAAARRAQDGADSAWVPVIDASAGMRVLGARDDDALGYVVGLSIDLPLFSRGQDLHAKAKARGVLAYAQAQAFEQSAQLAEGRAAAELALAIGERTRFETETKERVQQLEQAASSAYREGQRSVLELLDAQRTSTSVELRILELGLAAKRAELALRAARGEFE